MNDKIEKWPEFNWDQFNWIPEEIRTAIEAFWSKDMGRGPHSWIEDFESRDRPAIGELITTINFSGERVIGRWVHCWNIIGRLVHVDGSFSYVSAP